jgi:hypothetical protein
MKTTEKSMFFSTIWSVISANLNTLFNKEEYMSQIAPLMEFDYNKRILVIKELEKEKKLNDLFRVP